jgi:heat shock protein HslJ
MTCAVAGMTACSSTPKLNQAGELQPSTNINTSNPLTILSETRWEQVLPMDGSSNSLNSELRPAIQLEAGTGRFSGNDGCNRIMGSYQADITSLKFGQMASTRMACIPGNDAVSRNFSEALTRTATYRLESNYLILLDASGDKLLTLRKAGDPVAP